MVCVCARLYLISSDVVVTVFFYRLSLPDYKFFILRLERARTLKCRITGSIM